MTKVLIIEDEVNIRESIQDTLEFADYEVKTARNGVEGIEVAQKYEPDLILCDVMMPELDGYGVLLELSQDPKLSYVPFIFLTAKATKEDMRRGMALGADDYLTKPFTSPELLAAVKTRLERHNQLRERNADQMELVRQYINLTLPHELRTPLAGILGYLYMLEDGFEDMEPHMVRDMLGSIKRASGRLSHLIENYIAYGQIQLLRNDPDMIKKIHSYSTLKDFETLVQQTAESVAYDVGRYEDLVTELEPATVHIFFDHARKLISEIVNNAFKFSTEKTPVHIKSYVDGDYYIVAISNEGRGMTPQQIANIKINHQFERETYEQQGAGLGLAIAKIILEIYDGELSIESEQGKTTTTYVALKLV